MFDELVGWFGGTEFYLKYVSQWPAPFNIVSVDVCLLIVAAIFVAGTLYETVGNYKFKQRVRMKQQRNQEEALEREHKEMEREKREQERYEREQEERKAKRESDELMNQYMRFVMMAQMQNVSSCLGITFDQFKDMKFKVEEKKESEEKVQEPAPAPEPIVVERVVEKVVVDDSLAYQDELTKLGNRRAYNKAFEEAVASCMSVIYFDINNLKTTNDTKGHAVGDKLITTVASLIRNTFGEYTYRLGGDEFVVLLNIKDEGKVSDMVTSFRNKVADLNMEDPDGILYDTACGFCVSKKGLSKDDIQRTAEERMYENKKYMKATITEIEDEIEEETEEIFDTEEDTVVEVPDKEEDVAEWIEDDAEPEFLEPAPLVELEEDPAEEIVVPDLESCENDPEEDQEDPAEEVVNVEEILAEKASEKKEDSSDSMMSDFERLLNKIQEDKENEDKFKQYSEEKSRIKEKNAHVLESQVKKNLKVEGEDQKGGNETVKVEETEDFKQRKDKALKLEEKERIKAEKLAEKERKKAEKIAERERKKAEKKKG